MNKKASGEIAFGVTVLVLIIVAIVLFMGFDYVAAGHIGVRNRMGQVSDVPVNPGIAWTGVFTGTEKFTTRVQLKEYQASAASKDLQTVNTKIALNFKINPSSAPEIFRTIGKNYQDVIIAPIIQESVKSVTAQYTADALVTNRVFVKSDITDYIATNLHNKGLIVTEVSITDFAFSEAFSKAIEEKQVAEQDALTAKNRLAEMQFTSESMRLQTEVLEIKKLDIEIMKIDVQKSWIEKWNGQVPKIVTGGGSNDQSLFMLDVEAD